MTTLTEFLLARIAEDEAVARGANYGTPWESDQYAVTETTATPHGEVMADACWSRPIAAHIARFDPARVLAECEAKRQIVDLHAPIEDAAWPTCSCCGMYGEADVDWPCDTLRALALPHADHPDYREEWKP